jgi:3-dehydroquinate synthetase
MTRITVDLGPRSYGIEIGPNLLESLGEKVSEVAPATRCALITDESVGAIYGTSAQESLERAGYRVERIAVGAGETSKRLSVVGAVYDQMAAARLERKSPVIALGGGVVGDLAGFVAATYLRGTPFIQVPTTLLAQVDSSVGGKVGVNLPAGKNLVGAFYQPKLVLCDLDTLQSLPEREYRAGLAEVIKYGIIEDVALFESLEAQTRRLNERSMDYLAPVIRRCCEIKASVAQRDEREGGLRQILNFGHTIGHAIEAVAGYGGVFARRGDLDRHGQSGGPIRKTHGV